MTAYQDITSFVDAGREFRRPPVIGMNFLQQRPVGAHNVIARGPREKAEDLIRFFLRHRAAVVAVAAAPRVSLALSCFTPAGKPAVKISL